MLILTETEKAYLAGIFDGEGSVGYYLKKKTGYHRAQIAIYNSNPSIMQWLREKVGYGSISTSKASKYTNWAWICNSKPQVIEILKSIQSYLIIKADQVDLLLEFLDAEQKDRGVGSGKRLSKEEIASRNELQDRLKLLKTSNFQSIH